MSSKKSISMLLSIMFLSFSLFVSMPLKSEAAFQGNFWLPVPTAIGVNQTYLYGDMDSNWSQGHSGIDFLTPLNTLIFSASEGKVIVAHNTDDNAYGKYIIIESSHPIYPEYKVYLLYSHLNTVYVTTGQTVPYGQNIALSGATGYGVGPHLHFEIRVVDNKRENIRNPEGFLYRSNEALYGIIRGKVSGNTDYEKFVKLTLDGLTKASPDSTWTESFSYGEYRPYGRGTTPIIDFPDQVAYGINFYIARVNPGYGTLNYWVNSVWKNYQGVTVPTGNEVHVDTRWVNY